MRLLFASNLYPPHHIGGYEMVCRRTAEGLRDRGHEVFVLTSTHGSGPLDEGPVRRILACAYRPPDHFPDAGPEEAEANAHLLAEEIARLRPDAVVLWNLHGLGMFRLYRAALQESPPVATRLGDYQFWPDWDTHRPVPAEGLALLRDPRLRCAANCRTLGADLVRAGMDPRRVAVLHTFVDSDWPDLGEPPPPPPPLRALWAGRIGALKGLSVAAGAVIHLATGHGVPVQLDIVGDGDRDLLEASLAEVRAANRDGARVQARYLGPADHARLTGLFPNYHVYLAPSVGHDTFPMTPVEAMVAGVPVAASRLGGLVEITRGGRLGLLFEPGDAADLARQLRRLALDPRLHARLRLEARRYVEATFSREAGMDRFEAFALACVRGLDVASMPATVPKMSEGARGILGSLRGLRGDFLYSNL